MAANMSALSDDDEANLALEESLNLSKIKVIEKFQRLKDREAAVCAESRRLRAEAQKLIKQAEELDKQAKEIKSEAEAADELRDSLDCEIILLRLQRNCNDTTAVDNAIFPGQHGKCLGLALRGNTKVTKLALYMPSYFEFSESAKKAKKEIEPLVQFISNNESLIDFEATQFEGSSNEEKVADLLLEAVSKRTHMVRLAWGLPSTPSTFCRTLASLPSLQELDVAFPNAGSFEDDESQAIVNAFQACSSSLQTLKLYVTEDVGMSVQILTSFASSSSLQELFLTYSSDMSNDYDNALAQLLRSTSTLRRLELFDFVLDEGTMTAVLTNLQLQHVSALALRNGQIEEVEAEQLASLLQTKTTDSNGKTVCVSKLRELHVSLQDEMDETLSTQLAVSILEALRTNADHPGELSDESPFLSTVGSQLETLLLKEVHPSFFFSLKDHCNRVRLQTLELDCLSLATCVAFRKCIPSLVSICKLKITEVDSNGVEWILHGLKNNSSIVNVITDEDNDSDFSSSQLRLIDAYCERNKLLGPLLASEPSAGNDDNGSAAGDDEHDDIAVIKASQQTRPALLQTSLHVPNTCTTLFIRGLLVLGEFDRNNVEDDGKD